MSVQDALPVLRDARLVGRTCIRRKVDRQTSNAITMGRPRSTRPIRTTRGTSISTMATRTPRGLPHDRPAWQGRGQRVRIRKRLTLRRLVCNRWLCHKSADARNVQSDRHEQGRQDFLERIHLTSSGLNVMNSVKCRKPLDEARFAEVRAAFAGARPRLAAAGPMIAESPRAANSKGGGSGVGRRGNRQGPRKLK